MTISVAKLLETVKGQGDQADLDLFLFEQNKTGSYVWRYLNQAVGTGNEETMVVKLVKSMITVDNIADFYQMRSGGRDVGKMPVQITLEQLHLLMETFRIAVEKNFIFNEVAEELDVADDVIRELYDVVHTIMNSPFSRLEVIDESE